MGALTCHGLSCIRFHEELREFSMKRRNLGDLSVSAIGLGCMGMTPIYGTPDAQESIFTIHHALDHGIDLIDSSDAYAFGKRYGQKLVTLDQAAF